MLYAFYGSLRRGLENHLLYSRHMDYRYSMRIRGFKMFSVQEYPCAIQTQMQEDSIVVEVFEIQALPVCKEIERMEIEAGYYLDFITLQGREVAIFLFRDAKELEEVKGGDWRKFFK